MLILKKSPRSESQPGNSATLNTLIKPEKLTREKTSRNLLSLSKEKKEEQGNQNTRESPTKSYREENTIILKSPQHNSSKTVLGNKKVHY